MNVGIGTTSEEERPTDSDNDNSSGGSDYQQDDPSAKSHCRLLLWQLVLGHGGFGWWGFGIDAGSDPDGGYGSAVACAAGDGDVVVADHDA